MSGKNYVTVQGFAVTGTTGDGIVRDEGHDVTIRGITSASPDSRQQGTRRKASALSNTNNSLVSDNTIDHNTDYGIYLSNGSTATRSMGNRVFANARSASSAAPRHPSVRARETSCRPTSRTTTRTPASSSTPAPTTTCPQQRHLQQRRPRDRQLQVDRPAGHLQHRLQQRHRRHQRSRAARPAQPSRTTSASTTASTAPAPTQQHPCRRRSSTVGHDPRLRPGVPADEPARCSSGGSHVVHVARRFTSATGQESHGIQADPPGRAPCAGDFHLTAGSPAIDSANSGASGQPSLGRRRQSSASTTRTTPNTGGGSSRRTTTAGHTSSSRRSPTSAPDRRPDRVSHHPGRPRCRSRPTPRPRPTPTPRPSPPTRSTSVTAPRSSVPRPEPRPRTPTRRPAPTRSTVTVTDTAGLCFQATTQVTVNAVGDAPPAAALTCRHRLGPRAAAGHGRRVGLHRHRLHADRHLHVRLRRRLRGGRAPGRSHRHAHLSRRPAPSR